MRKFNNFPDEIVETKQSAKLIDIFVLSMLSILSMANVKYETYTNTARLLMTYLRNDPKVFRKFKASMTELKDLKMEKHIKVGKQNDSQILKKFKSQIIDENYLQLLKFCAYVHRHLR